MMGDSQRSATLLSRLTGFVSEVLRDFSNDECTSMAAALAYVTIFALPSMLLIIIYIAGLVLGPEAASGEIQARLSGAMGPQAAAEIQTMVRNIAMNRVGGIVASALGVAGLIVSATSLLLQLQMCLNRAWKVATAGSGIRRAILQRVRSGLLLAAAGVVAILSVATGSAISALSRMLPFAIAIHIADLVGSLAIFTVIFGGILKVMPDVRLQWRDVWVGGLFTAFLFDLGKFLVGIYLGHAGKGTVYGAAGSLAIILLWTYYCFLIFLLGVEFTQVWVRTRRGEITPIRGAVRAAGR
jgi:membrane protein